MLNSSAITNGHQVLNHDTTLSAKSRSLKLANSRLDRDNMLDDLLRIIQELVTQLFEFTLNTRASTSQGLSDDFSVLQSHDELGTETSGFKACVLETECTSGRVAATAKQ
jgi:hypothetical protein